MELRDLPLRVDAIDEAHGHRVLLPHEGAVVRSKLSGLLSCLRWTVDETWGPAHGSRSAEGMGASRHVSSLSDGMSRRSCLVLI
jgi:hypothetical protein